MLAVSFACTTDSGPPLAGSESDGSMSTGTTESDDGESTGGSSESAADSSSGTTTAASSESTGGGPQTCSLQPPTFYAGGAIDLAAVDVDGDGDRDVVASGAGLRMYGNDGAGKFTEPFALEGTNADMMAAAELDGDGIIDFVLAHSPLTDGTVTMALWDGMGSLTPTATFDLAWSVFSLQTGDVDGDGDIDVVGADPNATRVHMWLGDGVGGFTAAPDVMTQSGPVDMRLGDTDGDGDLDLVYPEFNAIGRAENDGTGVFGAGTSFSLGERFLRQLDVGDLDSDGDADVVVVARDNAVDMAEHVAVLAGGGDGTLGDAAYYAVGAGARYPRTADIDGDGALDVVVANTDDGTVGVLHNRGDGTLEDQVAIDVEALTSVSAAMDLDGDGGTDLLIGDFTGDRIGVMLSDCAG